MSKTIVSKTMKTSVCLIAAFALAMPALAQPKKPAGKPQGQILTGTMQQAAAANAPARVVPGQAKPAAEARGVYVAVVGAKAVTNDAAGVIDNATVVFRDGRIVTVAKGAPAPAGAQVIDGKGKWVTPGVISSFSRIGLIEVELEDSANDANVRATAVAAAADAADAFDPAAIAIPVTRVEGVTRAVIAPAGGPSAISGFGALVDMSGAEDSITRAKAFMYVEAGNLGASRAGQSRMTLWPYLEAAFDDAASYPVRYMSHSEGSVLTRAEAAAFVPVLKGETPLMLRVDRAADIRLALALKKQRPQLKLVIVGAVEGWRVANELAAAKVPVIVDPLRNLPGTFDTLGARLDNAALLAKAGVTVAIGSTPGSDEAHQIRLTPQYAGNAAANGLPWDKAFAAVSAVPADIFGLEGVGRLKAGAIADVVVWDGDPLEVMSAPEAVFIAGAPIALDSRQTALRDRYKSLDGATDKPFKYR